MQIMTSNYFFHSLFNNVYGISTIDVESDFIHFHYYSGPEVVQFIIFWCI